MTANRAPAQWYALLFGATLLLVGILGFGATYVVVTIWGFITGDQVLWLVPVDAADNVLHLAIAVVGIAAGLASPTRRASPAHRMSAPPRTVQEEQV